MDGSHDFDAMTDYKEYQTRDDWKKHRSPEYFEYRRRWEEIPANKEETSFPIHLDIETTDVCNLKCPMCSRTIKAEQGFIENRMMTWEEYTDIIDQAGEHGTKAIKLNYDGEPLAHRDIVRQIEYAKKQGILDVLINTNGTLLQGERGEPLLEAGLDGLFVSFDAISPDLFAQQRVGTTIGKVIDNLYRMIKLRDEKYQSCQIRIQMVAFDGPEWKAQFEALRVMWGHLVDALGYSPAVDYLNRDTDVKPKVNGWWCAQPFQRMVLKVNGNVTVCCPDSKDELAVGNWRNQRLYDIWNGEKFREIRSRHASGDYHSIDLCSRCDYPLLEKKI